MDREREMILRKWGRCGEVIIELLFLYIEFDDVRDLVERDY